MSEVIVRMEFRKNCLDCDLRQIVYGDSYADTDVYCSKENRFVGKRFGSTKDLARPEWCPIVCELPEQHGDLIDRNAFMKTIRPIEPIDESNFCSIETVKRIMVDRLSQAVILVPATKGKTEC